MRSVVLTTAAASRPQKPPTDVLIRFIYRTPKAPVACLALFLCLVSPAALTAPQHNIYLTKEVKHGVPLAKPTDQFGCSDKIYAVLELNGLAKGEYQLDAQWQDPRGADREHTKYPFKAIRSQERIWVWLKLHRAPEAALVQFANPSAGMDEFIGRWKLRLLLNGDPLATKEFNVLC